MTCKIEARARIFVVGTCRHINHYTNNSQKTALLAGKWNQLAHLEMNDFLRAFQNSLLTSVTTFNKEITARSFYQEKEKK